MTFATAAALIMMALGLAVRSQMPGRADTAFREA